MPRSLIISLHVVFALYLMLGRPSPSRTFHSKLSVHTRQLQPRSTTKPIAPTKHAARAAPQKQQNPRPVKPPAVSSASKPSNQALPSNSPTAKRAPKTTKSAPSTPERSSKPSPPEAHPMVDEILAKLDKTIGHLDRAETAAQAPIEMSDLSGFAADGLIAFLHARLKLPAYGSVRAALTLNAKGIVKKVEILDSKQLENSRYLSEALIGMELPAAFLPSRADGQTLIVEFFNES